MDLCGLGPRRLCGVEVQTNPDGTLIANEKIDEVRLFMLYAMFGGDAKRVAIVSQVPLHLIESLAHDFNWKAKLLGRAGLDTDAGKETEKALNRVTNFVLSERLKRVYSRLVDELDSDPSFAKSFCTSVDSETGDVSFNTKNLVELAKGIEIVTNISYRALQDKQAAEADVSGKTQDVTQLALATYKALANRFDRMQTVDATAKIVEAVQEARDQKADDSA